MRGFRHVVGIVIMAAITCLSGCNHPFRPTQRVVVVTTLFPQYDFAKHIAGDYATVKLLVPPGVEPHHFEPTPKDIIQIQTADLFILTHPSMEPWAMKVADTLPKSVGVLNVSQGIRLSVDPDGDPDDGVPAGSVDPHVWLDPILAKKMVDNITIALCQRDPQHATIYQKNAANYIAKLDRLDRRFKRITSQSTSNTIVLGGHSAFGYFAKRYGIRVISPYHGFAPDAEPTPKNIASVISQLKSVHQQVVFYEELLDPKVAMILSRDTGATLRLLHGAHNVSKDEMDRHITYIDIMSKNADYLAEALHSCR